jgi:hypothetical protein
VRLPRHAHNQDDPARAAERPRSDDDHEDEYQDADERENDGGRGGYLFTAVPDAPRLTLTESIAPRSASFSLSVPPERIPSGQIYSLGSPGSTSFEVVQVDEAPAVPGRPRSIRRALFGTVVAAHRAGTQVTAISVEHIDDWNKWSG